MTDRRSLAPWLIPLLVGLVVEAFVLLRISGSPMTSYGGPGAQFHTHVHRLHAWAAIQDAFAGRRNLLMLPFSLDGDFPPGIHVATGLMTAPFGHSLEAAMASGMVWVVLLAAAVGVLAARLSRRTAPDHIAGAAAATGVLLLASLQGFSVRYYYDIPFTALLWAGFAVVVWGWDGEGRRTSILGGLLLAAAALTKWTSLAFGGLMGLGLIAVAWLGAPGARSRRLRHLVVAGVLCAVLSLGYLAATAGLVGHTSFSSMFDTFSDDPSKPSLWTAERLGFYLQWTVRSIVSPALALLALPALTAWALRGREAAPFVAFTVLGHLLFVVGTVPVTDERFVLTAVPALVMAAGLGVARLGRLAVPWILLTAAVGLLVSWDFHFGRSVFTPAEPTWRLDNWRRLGLDSAWNADGAWARGDLPGEDCGALRERLWEVVVACQGANVAIGEADAPILRDGYWWAFETAERALLGPRGEAGRAETRLLETWSPAFDERREPLVPGVAFTTVLDGRPTAPEGVEMNLLGTLPAPACPSVEAVAVWGVKPYACWEIGGR